MMKSIPARRAMIRLSMLAMVSGVAGGVRGLELSDNLARAPAGTESATVERWLAASFTTDAPAIYHLNSVTLLLASTSPGSAVIDLHSDGGLEPGTLVATLTSPASYSETPAATTFGANGLALDGGATYWLVLRVESGAFEWAWTADNSGDGVGFNTVWDLSENTGSAWHTHDVYPPQLKVTVSVSTGSGSFRRGDANRDGTVDISDPIATLGYLFVGDPVALTCMGAADSNDDGAVDLSDAVFILTFKFLGGVEIPAPGAESCGLDPTTDQLPACVDDPGACGG